MSYCVGRTFLSTPLIMGACRVLCCVRLASLTQHNTHVCALFVMLVKWHCEMHGATIKSMKMNSKTNSTAGYDFKILKKNKRLVRFIFSAYYFSNYGLPRHRLTHLWRAQYVTTINHVVRLHKTRSEGRCFVVMKWSWGNTHHEHCDMLLILGASNNHARTHVRDFALHRYGLPSSGI